jgi:hypothetical protein
LYLVAIAFAFAGSALLMVGTLSSFPAWLDLYQFNVVNYNDAMIFYMFRHLLMAVLFIVRQYSIPRAITPFTAGAYRYCEREFLFTACVVGGLDVFQSFFLLSIDLVDNETRQFMVLWSHFINISLIVFWVVTLATLMFITRVRNLFWVGGNFCASAISSRSQCC